MKPLYRENAPESGWAAKGPVKGKYRYQIKTEHLSTIRDVEALQKANEFYMATGINREVEITLS
mgnify:CR=1 FL=1